LKNSAASPRVAIIVAQPQTIAPPHLTTVTLESRLGCNELITEALIILHRATSPPSTVKKSVRLDSPPPSGPCVARSPWPPVAYHAGCGACSRQISGRSVACTSAGACQVWRSRWSLWGVDGPEGTRAQWVAGVPCRWDEAGGGWVGLSGHDSLFADRWWPVA